MLATTWEEAGAQREEELLLLKRKSHCVVITDEDVNKYFTCQVSETGKVFPVLGNLTRAVESQSREKSKNRKK